MDMRRLVRVLWYGYGLVGGLLIVLLCLVLGCTGVIQGPPVNLEEVATPARIQETPALRQPAAPPRRGTFRAWVPRETKANGDVIEGHELEIGTASTTPEAIEPPRTIPRAPALTTPPTSTTKIRTPQAAPELSPRPALPAGLPPFPGGAYAPVVP